MKRFLLLLIILAVMVSGSPGLAREEPPQVKVARVEFEGTAALAPDRLAEVMETKAGSWQFWKETPLLDESALVRDKEAILQLYRNNGYYEAQVEIRTEIKDQWAAVKVAVKEGEPVKIRAINLVTTGFEKAEEESDLAAILRKHGLEKGRVFRLEGLQQAKTRVVRYLAERSRPKPDMKVRIKVSASQGWADAELTISPGPTLTMGRVSFVGLKRVNSEVAAKEVPWSGGEPFDFQLLAELKQRLMDLNVFASVRVEPILDGIETDFDGEPAPIKVTVVERKARSVEFGVGYGDTEKFKVRGALSVRSMLGLAEILSLSAHYSSRSWGGQANYRQPHFITPGVALDLRVGHLDENEVSFSNRRSFGFAGLEWSVGSRSKLTLGYLLELNRPYDIEVEHASWEDRNRWFSAAQAGFIRDTRDNRLDPTSGSLIRLMLLSAPRRLGSEAHLLKVDGSASKALRVNEWLVLAGRTRFAALTALEPSDDIPIYKRLFAGGSRSVRGYPYQKLGPLDGNGLPTGGLTLFEAGLEARFPLYGPFSGVVFTEVGNLSPDSWSLRSDDFLFTAGVGLRLETIVGPIRFDVGYQLNPPEDVDFNRFQFHFNIGQAF